MKRLFQFSKPTSLVQLPVKGQGILLFEYKNTENPCTLTFQTKDNEPVLTVTFSLTGILVTHGTDVFSDPDAKQGLTAVAGAFYWFSLDAQNQSLYAGIGEARQETATYKYTITEANEKAKKWFESIAQIQLQEDIIPLRLVRDPITRSVPLHVKDKDDLTMEDVAKGTYMPVSNLSETAQKLYNCIAGRQFTLNTPDFPDFNKAIEHSILTPGLWCYETLKAKSQEFGPEKNLLETYLRITLNENNGESPGIPYVMEIWPVGHYSPVHNHGGSHAVIRVLSGTIQVHLFPFLGAVKMFGTKEFREGDVTWISPALNQIHQLQNSDDSKQACITIQCYMYDGEDSAHYDYFDYLDTENKVHQFEPNSDMDFVGFKETIRREWNSKQQKQSVQKSKWYRLQKRIFGWLGRTTRV